MALNGFVQRIREVFSFDFRSLAVFRIGLALLIIFDLVNRARDIVAHYTDLGVFPRVLLREHFTKWFLSLHALRGDLWFEVILFLIAGVFAVMLLVGYKTRAAVIVSWILLISLQSRNPLVLQGGDIFFRMIVFWAMFLPLGAYWSLDQKLRPVSFRTRNWKRVFSIGTIGFVLQIALVYIFTALFKSGVEWFPEGSAVYYALSIDQFATPFGLFLLNFPTLLQGLTYFVLVYWYVGVVLLLVPLFFGPIRMIAISIFALLQLGIGASLMLGLFPWISIVALFPLLPSWFWDDLLSRFGVGRFQDFSLKGTLSRFDFEKMRDFLLTVVGAFFIGLIVMWNIQTISSFDVPDDYELVAYIPRVDQKWNMFSPYPLKDDGWYVIPGTLVNGQQVDLFKNGEAVVWDKPDLVSATYKNQRWRKYMMNLWNRGYSAYRSDYAAWLCREWNAEHEGEELLQHVEITFMRENTLLRGAAEPQKIVVLDYACFDTPNVSDT